MNPLVSICIPTYNGEKYIRECLDSVLAQTYSNLEIIIVDDCSKDDTIWIIDEYKRQDARVSVVRNQKNQGLVGNWNKCLTLANGEWIKFIFQDDLVQPDCVEKLLKAAGEHEMVISDRDFIFDESVPAEMKVYYNEKMLSMKKLVKTSQAQFISAEQSSQFAISNLALNFFGEPTCVMFKLDLVKKLGEFNANLGQICDLEYWLRVATSHGFVYVPEKLASFRIHASSTTSINVIHGKNFWPVFVDPMLLAHELMFNPVYREFRKNITSMQLKKLDLYLLSKMYEAKKAAEKNGPVAIDQVYELVRTYKDLEGYYKPSFASKLLYCTVLLRRKLKGN